MLQELALFPLNNVLFPSGILSLKIFEPRYLSMVSDCLRNDKPFLTVLIKEGQETGNAAAFHKRGTLAKIINFDQHSNGLLEISCRGLTMAEVINYRVQKDQLIIGQVEQHPSPEKSLLPLQYNNLIHFLKGLINRDGMDKYRQYLEEDWNNSEWVSCRLSEVLPLPQHQHYELLMMQPLERLELLNKIMTNNNWIGRNV